MPAVSNTSPISKLAWIGRLNLLRDQFREVWIPKAVEAELQNVPEPFGRKAIDHALRSGWLRPRAAADAALVSLLMEELHPGEAEAIAFAREMKAEWLLINEREGRSMARQLGLALTGVLGVLLRAKARGRSAPLNPKLMPSETKLGSS